MKIPPFRLVMEPLNDEAAAMPKYEYAEPEIGSRHRIGGDPNLPPVDEFPKCPQCNETMTFYGQLDSLNDKYTLADCGIIVVFVCFDCSEVHAHIESA